MTAERLPRIMRNTIDLYTLNARLRGSKTSPDWSDVRVADPNALVTLYTAAPDSKGMLGGLVSLGLPEPGATPARRAGDRPPVRHGPALRRARPDAEGAALHGAACHACLFVPETSCERGNACL